MINNDIKTIEMYWQTVCHDYYGEKIKSEVQEFLESKKIKKVLKSFSEDIIMVLGWDWTMLKAIREYYKDDKAFLSINFWTKWFLLNDKDYIDKNSQFVKREYPIMKVKVETKEEIVENIAFNEFGIKDTDFKTVDLNINIDDKNTLNIKWDWLLISTPAWSTAYNASLKWPILPHSSDHFTMPYMAAWEPKLQTPTLINNDSIVKIKNQWRINSLVIGVDSNVIFRTKPNQEVEIIIKKSKYTVKLLIEKSYESTWDNKVLKEQGFNN